MIYGYRCINGHEKDVFVHHPKDKGCEPTICHCNNTMGPVLSMGKGLLYFEEGRERIIYNLGPEPVRVRSSAQHKEAMKKAGVQPAPAVFESTSNTFKEKIRITTKGRWV